MITKKQIRAALKPHIFTWNGLDTIIEDDHGVDSSVALEVLEELDVENAAERIEYLTLVEFDVDTLYVAANMAFIVTRCRLCECTHYEGFENDEAGITSTDLQGVYSKDDLSSIEGQLNGEPVQLEFCYEHLQEFERITGLSL